MVYSPIVTPKAVEGWASRSFDLGTHTYDLNDLYSPDTELYKSVVLDLVSPKYIPNKRHVFDKSKYGNHGTITGAVWRQLPSGLWALSFDGDDLINIDDALTPIASDTVGTINMWVKAGDATPAATEMFICFGDTDATTIIRLYLASADAKLYADAYDGGVKQWERRVNVAPFTDDEFALITLVHNGTGPNLYFNGLNVAQTVVDSTDSTVWFSALGGIDNGRIGCANYGTNGNFIFFTGIVGKVLYSNYGMLTRDVLSYYNRTRGMYVTS